MSLGVSVEAQPAAPPVVITAERLLQFATHLFSQQEYFRAIGEYQRFLFLFPSNPEAPTAALGIAKCYFYGRRWQQALEEVDAFLREYTPSSIEWQARFLRARILTELGRGEEAREELRVIIEAHPGEPLGEEAWYRTGLSFAAEGQRLEADESFRQIGIRSRFHGAAQEVRQILAEDLERKRKDPVLAGVLAALIPGTGHLYCERPKDAALAFLFTGAFAWATAEAFEEDHEELGVGLGLIALAFYGGNIFSAVNVAHKFNDRQERRLQRKLAPYQQMDSNRHQSTGVSLALKFFF